MAEFDAGAVGGELPIDLTLLGVGRVLPSGELGVQDVEVIDASVEALPGQRGELDLGDVEPGPVFGGVMDLEPLGQRERLGGLESLVKIEQVPWRTYSESSRRSCPGFAGIGSRACPRSW